MSTNSTDSTDSTNSTHGIESTDSTESTDRTGRADSTDGMSGTAAADTDGMSGTGGAHRTPRQIAETYFTAWESGDYATLRGLFADDVDFAGPLGTASGAEDCLAGLKGLGALLTRIDVRARVADETDVVTWFDLHTSVAAPATVANWTRVADGRITHIRVTFDPRELLAGLEKG